MGPAKVGYRSKTFFSSDDIDVPITLETIKLKSSVHGKVDERQIEAAAKIPFTPIGAWTTALLPILWPRQSPVYGASIFSSADIPLTLNGTDDKLHTFKAVAITKMPSIHLGATKTIIGPVEFTAIRADGSQWTDAGSLMTIGSNAYADATFVQSDIKIGAYTAAWGVSSPWDSFEAAEGWTIEFQETFSTIQIDSRGIADMKVDSISVMARCIPVGPLDTDILTALKIQDSGNPRGRSMNAGSANLVITGAAGPVCTIYGAAIQKAGYVFGTTKLRAGEIGFVNTVNFASGVPSGVFLLA
jgi:hypothetical protein